MRRRPTFLVIATVFLPTAALIVLAPPGVSIGVRIAGIVLWLAGVIAATEVLSKHTRHTLSPLFDAVEADDLDDALHRVVRLHEDAARDSKNRDELAGLLGDISTGLGEGLLVVDFDLRLRFCNPRACHFFDIEPPSPGTSLADIEPTPDILAAVRTAVAGETAPRVLTENPRGAWEIRPFPVVGSGAVVLITEIGSLRRTAELRRRFVQDLSHEIRSPLTVMRTTVEALEDEVPPELAAMLVRQVERITRLTDELHELASIESGAVDLLPTEQPILPVIRQIVDDFSGIAARHGITLRIETTEDFSFPFDRRGVARILSNLVDNAVKYNRPGGRVVLRAIRLADEAIIEVEDSGLGIPAAELGAVMQRFYRIDRARTPGVGGLGLGLAIVKHMVQQMSGDLVLDSREDAGTRVTLGLPLEPGS